MTYRDILHGEITFGDTEEGSFVSELIASPEVQRLRFMRMLNQDAQYMQELATSRRFAHAIGTCSVASQICRRSQITVDACLIFLAAALIHDIGILPYGHLVEREFGDRDHSFSHEELVRQIVHGIYHPTNVYHQLLPGLSLEIPAILKRYDVNQEAVLDLITPRTGHPTAVAGPLDVDNIDNVHRMAALLGYPGAAVNLKTLISALRIDGDLQLTLDPAGIEAVETWLEYRRSIYSQMIGHPACVAYNAFLQDLVRRAIKIELIRPEDWYINDLDFESKLLENADTKPIAKQLRTGCRYRLLDYTWLQFDDFESSTISSSTVDTLIARLPCPPVEGAVYRSWFEANKTTRRLHLNLTNGSECTIGRSSLVILIAMIDPGVVSDRAVERFQAAHGLQNWRKQVIDAVASLGIEKAVQFNYPEDCVWKGVGERYRGEQLRLF